MPIERPLEFLDNLKEKNVSVIRKGPNSDIDGKLIAFDIHINLVIETSDGVVFIRGDIVETVMEKTE